MAKYNLNISHNNIHEEITYSDAIELVNNYDRHRVGQPLAVIYYDEIGNRKLLLAVGKRDYTEPLENGATKGEQFYEIINKDSLREYHNFMIIKNNEVYIRGIDVSGDILDYKILNKQSINKEEAPESIVTLEYLNSWCSFENLE